MYYLLYEAADGSKVWELVSGEDAMDIRVSELMDELGCFEDDIVVFHEDSQLN